jgi:hypothetical protein
MRTKVTGIVRSRVVALAMAVFAATSLTACDEWLKVTNPGAIENPALENPAYLQLMYDGVVGDFQPAYAWTALFSGLFTDELRVTHTFFENLEIDQRRVSPANGTYALAVFNGLHRARFMADSVASRFRNLLADTVSNDVRYAQTMVFAGYSWLLLGENLCETRINAQGERLQPNDLFAGAVERFTAAMAAAQVARTAAERIANVTNRNRAIALADTVLNVARVGAARAHLNAGNTAAALSNAQAVTPAYVSDTDQGLRYNLIYRQGNSTAETRRMGLPYWEFISAGGSWASLSGTPFENLNDPRVPHGPAGSISVSMGGAYFVPNSPRSFNTYDGTIEGARFVGNAGAPGTISRMRMASAIEARYIIAEAGGLNAANVEFVNAQRAIGGQAPLVNPTESEYRAALREQRAREFFIDGHRLGDLRRYEARHGVDLWETGPMYGGTTTFGEQKCWPTPTSELY